MELILLNVGRVNVLALTVLRKYPSNVKQSHRKSEKEKIKKEERNKQIEDRGGKKHPL